MSEPAPDRNVEAVVDRLRERSRAGLAKYGVTTERGDLTLMQWLQHLQEELLDAAIYVERVKAMWQAVMDETMKAVPATLADEGRDPWKDHPGHRPMPHPGAPEL